MHEVSVCIPTYNRFDLLLRAIASVRAQEGVDYELVVSDNASTDGSWERLEALAAEEPGLRLQRNATNLGFAGNLNACVAAATGRYVLLLCDDDELMPGMLAACRDFLAANPSVGMVHAAGVRVEVDGAELVVRSDDPPVLKSGVEALGKIALGNDVLFSSAMVPRAVYAEAGAFTDTCSADWEMWARIARRHDLGYLDTPLLRYHAHGASRTPPEAFARDWTLLCERIVSYFPPGEQARMRRGIRDSVGNGFWSMARQALRARGWARALSCVRYAWHFQRKAAWLGQLALSLQAAAGLLRRGRTGAIAAHETHV